MSLASSRSISFNLPSTPIFHDCFATLSPTTCSACQGACAGVASELPAYPKCCPPTGPVHLSRISAWPLRETPPATCSAFPECWLSIRITSLRSKCICVASVFCHSARLRRLRAQLSQSASLAYASQVCTARCICVASVFCHSATLCRLPAQLSQSASLACASQVCAASASVLHPCFATPRDSASYLLSFPRVLAQHARHKFAQQVHLCCIRVLPLRETPPATCSAFPEC